MHIIFNTHSSHEEYNGDCDYAIVELTPALAEQIRRRVALAREAGQQDNDLHELYFWGSTAEFFDHNVLEACQDAAGTDTDQAARDWLTAFEQTEYAVVPAGVDFTAHEAQRTECDQVVLRVGPSSWRLEPAVAWTASVKHSDVYVTTSELPLTALEDLLAASTPQPR